MILPYMEWHVTDDCIRNGIRNAPEFCPVSIAGKTCLEHLRISGVETIPHVDRPLITVYHNGGEDYTEYGCSVKLGDWMVRYDTYDNVWPITVVLSVDQGGYVAYIKGEANLSTGKDNS